jgi:4'-phosphopantetheinyl transferase EntD
VLALGKADKGPEVLLGGERQIGQSYQNERLRQFCSGRYLARQAIQAIGGSAAPILRMENGAPLWPDDYIGSLSHSGELVGAIAGCRKDWFGMGLDVERQGRVRPDLWPILFTPEERCYLENKDNPSQRFLSTAFFSIKEAFLKLPSPKPERVQDYQDIEVVQQRQRFSLRGNKIDLRCHFGLSYLSASVFLHEDFVVSTILLELE